MKFSNLSLSFDSGGKTKSGCIIKPTNLNITVFAYATLIDVHEKQNQSKLLAAKLF